MNRTRFLVLSLLAFAPAAPITLAATPPQFDLPTAAATDPAALDAAMPKLAEQVLDTYKEADQDKYLDNLFRLQMVAGKDADALKTLGALRALRAGDSAALAKAIDVQFEIYADAKARQAAQGLKFEAAFPQAFHDKLAKLDDRTTALVMRELDTGAGGMRGALRQALGPLQGKTMLTLDQALALVHAYQVVHDYQDMRPLLPPLVAEDDQRRYIIADSFQVKTVDGASVCATVIRPRSTAKLPALLEFSIYADSPEPGAIKGMFDEARRSASNGYIGVVGLTRGKACSPGPAMPYEHDGADADALIEWISRQPWSDGRVGMFGGSYNGFAQWAAAKHLPKALKALMPAVTAAPGLDVPMEGNVVESFLYSWPSYVTNNKYLDDAGYDDNDHWNKLYHDWYVSGRPYRDLDKLDGKPNPIFDRWLQHPAYDAYWQSLIPYKQDFAAIDIPVLTTAGYFYGGPGAVTYYFSQHYQYNPKAQHYLVIGPYDHFIGQFGTKGFLSDTTQEYGLTLDPAAQIDMGELRYQWFDYVFKGAPKPALLQDKVNYEVMGANTWKHAPTFAAMQDGSLRYFLTPASATKTQLLTEAKGAGSEPATLSIDLKDRSDADRTPPTGGGIVDHSIDTWNGVEYVSEPLKKDTEVSGLFSGHLDVLTNKKDMDFVVEFYELTPAGDYVDLSYRMVRASYLQDRSQRKLLTLGVETALDFKSERLTSRVFPAGSRFVILFYVLKGQGTQINYGTGKDVNDESVADAGDPLQIKIYGSSYIDIPIWK
jgi:putative CocE/NonD family hydrolase